MKYLIRILSRDGVRPDSDKVNAILQHAMTNQQKGFAAFLGNDHILEQVYTRSVHTHTGPLRQLLKKDIAWHWTDAHEKAVRTIKQLISQNNKLNYFDPDKQSVIQADSSSVGLGACLMQDGLPVAYVSRSFTSSERNYAQIENELLAIVFACDKFKRYIYDKEVVIQSDYKPLESVFRKPISSTTPWLQRMLLRLLKYQLKIVYVPGSKMYIADTLLRASISDTDTNRDDLADDIDVLVHSLIYEFPVSNKRLEEFRAKTADDPVCVQSKEIARHGSPTDSVVNDVELKTCLKFLRDIYELDELLFVQWKLIVPTSMRLDVLKLLYHCMKDILALKSVKD